MTLGATRSSNSDPEPRLTREEEQTVPDLGIMSAWQTEFQAGARGLREFNRSLAEPASPERAAVVVAALRLTAAAQPRGSGSRAGYRAITASGASEAKMRR